MEKLSVFLKLIPPAYTLDPIHSYVLRNLILSITQFLSDTFNFSIALSSGSLLALIPFSAFLSLFLYGGTRV
jgi:hypothetical protein